MAILSCEVRVTSFEVQIFATRDSLLASRYKHSSYVESLLSQW
jgi:hypothetical protein